MKLLGIFVACVTPWKQGRTHANQVDEAALWRHLEMLLAAGVNGLCVAGSTGEFPRLNREEYTRLVRATVEIAAGRVPVVAGVGHAAVDGSLELAHQAALAGADAVMAPPPFYFPYNQPEITAFYQRLAQQAALPVILYNIPQFTSPIQPHTATALLRQGPFVGIKDSGGDLKMLEALLEARRDRAFGVLCGADSPLVSWLERGADGALSGLAACAPEAVVALYRAARAGERAELERAQAHLNELVRRLERFPFPVGIRLALEARGMPVGPHAVPLAKETEAAAKQFALWFDQWLGQGEIAQRTG